MGIEDRVIKILENCNTIYEMEVLQAAYNDYINGDRVNKAIADSIINELWRTTQKVDLY